MNHRKAILFGLAAVLVCLFFNDAVAGDKTPEMLILKAGQAYSFSERKPVVNNPELLFTAGTSGTELRAVKIQGYGKENPKKVNLKETAGWKAAVDNIQAGNYYILLGNKEKLYLVKVVSIKSDELALKWLRIDKASSKK